MVSSALSYLFWLAQRCLRHFPMSKLQRFYVGYINWCQVDYVDALKALRGFLTHLDLVLDRNFRASLPKCDIKFFENLVASFDRPKYLRLNYKELKPPGPLNNVDLPNLFSQNNKGLQTVLINGHVKLNCEARYLEPMIDAALFPIILVETLDINVEGMDIRCLVYITKELKKIKNLTIEIKDVVTVDDYLLALQNKDMGTIIQDLRDFCDKFSGSVKVDFLLQNRQERVQISHN